MACKGICPRYKAPRKYLTGYYSQGFKRCNVCHIFVKWEGVYCPCCNTKLRSSARSSKTRKKLAVEVSVK